MTQDVDELVLRIAQLRAASERMRIAGSPAAHLAAQTVVAGPVVWLNQEAGEWLARSGASERTQQSETAIQQQALRFGLRPWTWVSPDEWAIAPDRYLWIGRAAKLIGSTSEEDRAIVHASVRDGIEAAAYEGQIIRGHIIPILGCIPEGAHAEVTDRVCVHLREMLDGQRAGHELDGRALDLAFCAALKRLGDDPRDWAKQIADVRDRHVRTEGSELYAWTPRVLVAVGAPDRLRLLARAVGYRIAEERRRPGGLVRGVVMDRLIPAITGQTRTEHLDASSAPTLLSGQTHLADVDVAKWPHSIESLQRSVDQLATPTGNRLLKHLILRATEAWCRGDHDHSHVTIRGGLGGLAEAIGAASHDTDLIYRLLSVGSAVQWRTPDVIYGGLWTYGIRQPRRNTPGEVRIRLGEPLDPGYANRMAIDAVKRGDTTSLRMARRLVPELRHEPPMGTPRRNDHAAVWALHRLTVVELVDRAEELARHGAVVIGQDRWREQADTARLPASILPRTLDAWVAGESKRAPALLVREGEEFTLADPHAAELDFIMAGGKLRIGGRRRSRGSRRR